MAYIEKMVVHGFKSFARKTEIPLENAMNVIVGPNGSGKSNITDALCFALGRLSIKSIRAAKAANLIFSGNKHYKAAQEASVELIFNNSDKAFVIDSENISIKRTVRKNGQSIYKINNQTKTRQELLELLAQAGIDPNGFNIVLQGEIASLIKINSEERRKIIEDVAGISIYETRKTKSTKELEKSNEKIKEISAILRERNSYLKNLEKEKQEAENYQKLEISIKRCKATIISKEKEKKEKEKETIFKNIREQTEKTEKIKNKIKNKMSETQIIEEQIQKINKQIQLSTSSEQETLHHEISELKIKLAELKTRKENFETRKEENNQKRQTYSEKIKEIEQEIKNAKTTSPEIKKQQSQIKTIQEKLDILEINRRKFYRIKSELSTQENNRQQLITSTIELKKEIEITTKNITYLFDEIKYEKSIEKSTRLKLKTKEEIEKLKEKQHVLENTLLKIEKQNAVSEEEEIRQIKLKKDIIKLDICPLCKNKITKEHMINVIENANEKISNSEKRKNFNIKEKEKINKLKTDSINKITNLEKKINEIEIDIIKLKNANEKKEKIKKITETQASKQAELNEANTKIFQLKKQFEKLKNIEEEYDETRLKIQEFSFADIDIDTEINIKQRESNRLQVELKSAIRKIEESESELKTIDAKIKHNEQHLKIKEGQEQELYEKFQKLFSQKNEIQDKQKAIETDVIGLQHVAKEYENKTNDFKIEKAKTNAQIESINIELKEYETFEIYNQPIDKIKEKLQKSQMKISNFGSINSRALEIYDKIKEKVEQIEKKVETIEREKEKIIKIIDEIDKKKKKSFMKTLNAVNEYFTRNFTQLSRKGEVFLDLDNKQEPFNGGLSIILKVARGKYFDVSSLSGGEKTLVALSLIFAIQEYKPYCFYIFDEIDAALDKHNSELLAALIKKYMLSGQYLIITHNDALISEALTLYGVSMQENISKVISLKI